MGFKKPAQLILGGSIKIKSQLDRTHPRQYSVELQGWIGKGGYYIFGELAWIDSFLIASMILTGMGPVDHLNTSAGKIFSALYALFSGISFLTFVTVLFAPAYHRFLHKFHLTIGGDE
ncbi:MAG: hypothetical protein ABSB79_13180 [Syntrophales bacterium]|jgi:hypothetical protein